MTKRSVWLGVLLVAALGAAFLAGASAMALWIGGRRLLLSGPEPEVLAPGAPRSSALDLPRVRERTFTLDVPEHTVALRVKLVARGTELNLAARRGRRIGGDEGADFSVSTDSGEATLSIGRFTDPPLEAGPWSLRVAWTSDVLPTTPEHRLMQVPFTVEASLFEPRVDGDLVPGKALEGSVDPEDGGFASYRVDVPPGSPALRIDLFDVESDLDLYLRRGGPVLALGDDVRFAQHPYGRESLLVGGTDGPVEPGTWYVDVVDAIDTAHPAPFRIVATLASEPPAELLEIPSLTPPKPGSGRSEPLAAALQGVVEIATDDSLGSGTILSRDGWVLTNAHVVGRVGGGSFDEVVVSATLDPRRPPVELFRGKVERVDEDRDLALVRITTGFYGQALPPGYAFPSVPAGDPDELSIGDPIWLIGYPSTGGQGSRVTITCTRGVVSGYETADFGPVIKTDAEITNGNSGGAALDGRGRLVGVPTSLVELGSGQVAYVHPLSALPEEWRELVQRGAKR
jgi:S1-C subfamily serine protease